MQKSMRFFIRMLPVFLARVKPASHMAKPACMKKTSAAPTRTQMVLTDEYITFSSFSGGSAPPGSRLKNKSEAFPPLYGYASLRKAEKTP